jgi:hypothetical protein
VSLVIQPFVHCGNIVLALLHFGADYRWNAPETSRGIPIRPRIDGMRVVYPRR